MTEASSATAAAAAVFVVAVNVEPVTAADRASTLAAHCQAELQLSATRQAETLSAAAHLSATLPAHQRAPSESSCYRCPTEPAVERCTGPMGRVPGLSP